MPRTMIGISLASAAAARTGTAGRLLCGALASPLLCRCAAVAVSLMRGASHQPAAATTRIVAIISSNLIEIRKRTHL
jgi:hypothetical protein